MGADTLAPMLGYAAAALGSLGWLPQLLRTLRTRQVRDISLWTTVLIFVTVCLWLAYGLLLGAWPIIIANLLSATVLGVLLAAKILWEKP